VHRVLTSGQWIRVARRGKCARAYCVGSFDKIHNMRKARKLSVTTVIPGKSGLSKLHFVNHSRLSPQSSIHYRAFIRNTIYVYTHTYVFNLSIYNLRTICANVLYFAHYIHVMEHYMHIWGGKGSWKLKLNCKLYLEMQLTIILKQFRARNVLCPHKSFPVFCRHT